MEHLFDSVSHYLHLKMAVSIAALMVILAAVLAPVGVAFPVVSVLGMAVVLSGFWGPFVGLLVLFALLHAAGDAWRGEN